MWARLLDAMVIVVESKGAIVEVWPAFQLLFRVMSMLPTLDQTQLEASNSRNSLFHQKLPSRTPLARQPIQRVKGSGTADVVTSQSETTLLAKFGCHEQSCRNNAKSRESFIFFAMERGHS